MTVLTVVDTTAAVVVVTLATEFIEPVLFAGAEWISCKCGRWLHESCVEDVVKDNAGDECYCSFCIDKYTI